MSIPHSRSVRSARDSLLAAIVGLGMGLRLAEVAQQRGFWVDEVRIAVSVVRLTYAGLLGPILFDQGAPFGFLALSKLSSELFGSAEWALRLPSLLTGLVSCVCVALLAAAVLPRPMARLVTLLFAVSPWLVYYTGELKPYVFDMTVVLALGLVSSRPLQRTARGRMLLIVGGAAAPWVSMGSLFGLAGMALVLGVDVLRAPKRASATRRGWLGATLVVGAVSAAVGYRVNSRHFAWKRAESYWAECFMPTPWTDVQRTVRWLVEVLPNDKCLGGLLVGDVPVLLVWAGIAGLCLSVRRAWGLYWCGVFAAAFGLSSLGLYSLTNRIALFLVPGLLLGLGALIGTLSTRRTWVSLILTALLLIALAPQWRASSRRSDRLERWSARSRDLMSALSTELEAGDRIWSEDVSRGFVEYYLPRFSGPDGRFAEPEWFGAVKGGLVARPGDRIWVVDALMQSHRRPSVRRIEHQLTSLGALRRNRVAYRHAEAVLWELPPAPRCAPDGLAWCVP